MIKFTHNPLNHMRPTSPFGWRIHPITGVRKLHNGVDLGAKVAGRQGDPIYAVADGTVTISKCDSGNPKIGYGYYCVIDHGGWCSLYAHQIDNDIRAGAKVKSGQQIGRMGSSGSSTAAHLHLGVTDGSYNKKQWVDPAAYLMKEGVKPMSKAEAIKTIQAACQFEDGTMQFLDNYRYGDALLIKLATAIKGGK